MWEGTGCGNDRKPNATLTPRGHRRSPCRAKAPRPSALPGKTYQRPAPHPRPTYPGCLGDDATGQTRPAACPPTAEQLGGQTENSALNLTAVCFAEETTLHAPCASLLCPVGALQLLRGAEKAKATPSLSLWRGAEPQARAEMRGPAARPRRHTQATRAPVAHAEAVSLKGEGQRGPQRPSPCSRAGLLAGPPPARNVWKTDD